MRKNGFTLIEVVGIIIVIALVSLITVPIIIQSVNNNKSDEQLCADAKFAIETYLVDLKKKGDIPNFSNPNETKTITLGDLVNNGYLNNKNYDLTKSVLVTINENNTYKMECNF